MAKTRAIPKRWSGKPVGGSLVQPKTRTVPTSRKHAQKTHGKWKDFGFSNDE